MIEAGALLHENKQGIFNHVVRGLHRVWQVVGTTEDSAKVIGACGADKSAAQRLLSASVSVSVSVSGSRDAGLTLGLAPASGVWVAPAPVCVSGGREDLGILVWDPLGPWRSFRWTRELDGGWMHETNSRTCRRQQDELLTLRLTWVEDGK
jgi:hypothetical protein